MPYFNYRATDPSGRLVEGKISAATADAARDALTQGGFRVGAIGPASKSTPPPPSPARTAVAPAPTRSYEAPRAPQPVVVAAPTPKAPPATLKTPPGRYRDLYFMFGQIGSLFDAGVTPHQIFNTLSARAPSRYKGSLQEMAAKTAESARISEVMERYPYLYPPSAVGMMRAGEAAGFMPGAADRIAQQNYSIHRLHRRLSWLLGYFCFLMFFAQVTYAILIGSLNSIKEQSAVDGNLPINQTLIKNINGVIGQNLALGALWVGIILFVYFLWNTMPMRMARHSLSLKIPILAGRANAEAMATFGWAASMISTAGMSAQQTMVLAAQSVPNLVLRQRMMEAAGSMVENEAMSTVVRRSGILPVEFGHMIETGEITGTIPNALGQIATSSQAEFEAKDVASVKVMTLLLTLAMGTVVVIILAAFYRMYFSGLITTLTADPT